MMMKNYRVMVKKEAFKALTRDGLLQPNISDLDFRSSNIRAAYVGYKLYVFDIRYQENFTVAHPIEVDFKIDGGVPNDMNGYALVLTDSMVSVSSDGQRRYDLV